MNYILVDYLRFNRHSRATYIYIHMSELQLFGAVEIFALFGSSFESIETFVIVASLGV